MKVLILAGGSGTRLWPLSRKNYPKQFLKLNGDMSLLQKTAERLLHAVSPDDIIVMTNNEYKFHVMSDLRSLPFPVPFPDHNIILEPLSRNTAPAIALGIKYCIERLGCKEDDVLFISPSDHIIDPADKFACYIGLAEGIAKKGHIVTFGIKPTRAETGYGYIKANKPASLQAKSHELKTVNKKQYEVGSMQYEVSSMQHEATGRPELIAEYYKVEKFTEKPDIETAVRYIKEGGYYWNSGMFAFSIGTMMEELARHAPEIRKALDADFDEMVSGFSRMPDISIDYAVMEKSENVVTLPMDIYWNDIGSWDSLFDVLDKDKDGNAKTGDVLTIDTKNTMILGDKRLVAAIGMENCLIVETGDAILISSRGRSQKVKDLINILKGSNRKEASEHVTTYRPWGSYTILEEGERYKIKRIVVNPLATLSLQKHYHRSEHWVVIKGTAKVTIADRDMFIHENESAFVPKSTLHRLENPGKVPLEIIEVQNGEYVGEDDIVRVDDVYGRNL